MRPSAAVLHDSGDDDPFGGPDEDHRDRRVHPGRHGPEDHPGHQDRRAALPHRARCHEVQTHDDPASGHGGLQPEHLGEDGHREAEESLYLT